MKIYFGGPDKPPYHLRNLLAEKVSSINPGGEIFWITYYFRDLYLAEKLIEAADRGVKVSVVLEAKPRVEFANDEVCNFLKNSNKIYIHYITHRKSHKKITRKLPKIHEKIYYFKDDNKCFTYIGTFNPSGRQNDDPHVIELIGDQDRGHNYLVELDMENDINGCLYRHCQYIKAVRHGWYELIKRFPAKIITRKMDIYFFPWAGKQTLLNFLSRAEKNDNIYIAMSHFTAKIIADALYKLAKKGVNIQIISHDTERRFPEKIESLLNKYSIDYKRYIHPKKYPMHNKFIILEKQQEKSVCLGSLNLTKRSLYENHEILAIIRDENVVDIFKKRWHEMHSEIVSNSYA